MYKSHGYLSKLMRLDANIRSIFLFLFRLSEFSRNVSKMCGKEFSPTSPYRIAIDLTPKPFPTPPPFHDNHSVGSG